MIIIKYVIATIRAAIAISNRAIFIPGRIATNGDPSYVSISGLDTPSLSSSPGQSLRPASVPFNLANGSTTFKPTINVARSISLSTTSAGTILSVQRGERFEFSGSASYPYVRSFQYQRSTPACLRSTFRSVQLLRLRYYAYSTYEDVPHSHDRSTRRTNS